MPLRQVLALQFLLGPFHQGAIEDAGFGEPHLAQGLTQVVRLESLESDELERGNGRTLLQHNHQHLPLDFKAHVLEETGGEQRLDRRRRLLVRHRVPDLDRQVGKHGASLGALNSLDADILDRKRIERRYGLGQKRRDQPGKQFLIHLV